MIKSLNLKELGVFVAGAIIAIALYHQLMVKANLAVWMTALFNIAISASIGYLTGRKFAEKGLLVFTGFFLIVQVAGYVPATVTSSRPIWTTGFMITLVAETLVALSGMGSVLLLRALQKSNASRAKRPAEPKRGDRATKVHKL